MANINSKYDSFIHFTIVIEIENITFHNNRVYNNNADNYNSTNNNS